MGAMEDPGSRPVHSLIYGSGSLEPFWVSVSPSIKKKKKKRSSNSYLTRLHEFRDAGLPLGLKYCC